MSTTTWEEAYAAFSAGRTVINHCASDMFGSECYQRVVGMRREPGEDPNPFYYRMISDTGENIEGFMGLSPITCNISGEITIGYYTK